MSNNNKPVHLETTPRVYYENYTKTMPSYDLYPALSRRLGNGYVHQPVRPKTLSKKQNHFLCTSPRRIQHREQQQNTQPPWDLYPAMMRSYRNLDNNDQHL
ncbi:hypothetical protein A0J61_08314 [Choanephora cucurbitarum]|uniref:Uncharacterized protein n=1 Tax=Choanephora cucurbitarum TaxID=101091 RepID=A0A1C7N4P9_9FUNG|nr:hypothetical protein A0J61_08314 [Choanephora cucurbitarum]